MGTARLEIIKDDDNISPHMSRGMPAALDGLLTQAAFDNFCDKLDEILDLLHTDLNRYIKRGFWIVGVLYFWVVFLALLLLDNRYWLFIGALILSAVHIGTVWFCTAPGAGVKSYEERIRIIRSECDEMTRHTPFVSFHVVMVKSHGAGFIDYIGVSISSSASVSGVATTTSAILVDTRYTKIAELSDNHCPMVPAQDIVRRLNRAEMV
jgi:hypothetical protein